jgi:NADH dehydrogenase
VIHALEEAAIEREDKELRQQLLTFVVAGGGFSGVEVVAELNDFVRDVARHYRGLDPKEVRVVLLHSQDRILPEMEKPLALFAQKILTKRGVELRLNTKLDAASGTEALLAGGERIPTRTLVSTVPSFPNPLIDALKVPKQRGKVETDSSLRVPGFVNLWAVGDCALVKNPDGQLCPPTAQHAIREATCLAHNLVASLRGGSPRVFEFKGLGKMGSLGHRSAVAELPGGIKLSGFVAWFFWRSVYLMKLPGWGRRLKVGVSWGLDLFLPPELVQLRLKGQPSVHREHFEPGQEIFEQGDLGDRVYIMQSGKAEVIRTGADGREERLATLGPGECFGEMAVLGKTSRMATVRCVESMDVLSLPQREFAALADNIPDMRKGFERVAQARSAEDTGRLKTAGR